MAEEDVASVLVVEDERELAEAFARWLEDSYEVETAYTGEEALSAVDESVDVVLLDRRLPDMPGGDVLQVIRDRGYDCRVAMITAVDPDFDVLEMPFDDYVVKPLLKDTLRETVERLLRLATYDSQFQESFALVSKLSALEAEKTEEELAGNEDYLAEKRRFEDLREAIEGTLEEFETDDFRTAYRDLAEDV